ncbi:TFIID-18kDa-domain-containing protein [Penicillium waksmanii]|uniref:TFIID-18kDa-domain-containing protein n=1 Tax=Penicillium waksmanii TaxID=69791 RepID=UPI002546F3DB|nr:TFIID-18kDa-domain-containing protein [Penicillium waksmanii]KAJ5975594.1 TFIID-18kDa-domain-containing protein [Penicillium waksmanii]
MADDGQPPVTQITPEEQELASSGELQNLSTSMFFEDLLPLNLGRFGQLGSFADTSPQDWKSDVDQKPKLGPHWTSHYGRNLFLAAASPDPNTSGFSMNPGVPGDVDTPSTDIKEEETEEDKKHSQKTLADLLPQMMFVSGETAEPSIDTTTLIEEITRQQVIEILTRSTSLATRRGSRSISTDDLIFLIRHDKAKVSRLRTFLSWKDVRKNVKDSDDKGGGDAADFAAADDAAGAVAGPTDVAAKPKNKRAKVGLAWDVNSLFSVQIPEREDEEDEEEEEQNYATLQRLAAADERTKYMTKEEYVFWSECRQASFTYRKSKRFREWAGFGIVTESKPNDDIVDILGFLTFEIVQTLTEEALKVKVREDHEKNRGGGDNGDNAKKRKRETGRTPIEPRHVREAYRKLQATPQKNIAMLLHEARVPARMPLQLI